MFLRLAASKDKAGSLHLAAHGQIVEQPADLLREPYVFEFLKISEPYQVSEIQLETVLCDHLFVQKYQLYLPDRDALRRELELSLRAAEQ